MVERLLWKGVVGRIILAWHYIHGNRDLRVGGGHFQKMETHCLMHNNICIKSDLQNTFSYEIMCKRVTHH